MNPALEQASFSDDEQLLRCVAEIEKLEGEWYRCVDPFEFYLIVKNNEAFDTYWNPLKNGHGSQLLPLIEKYKLAIVFSDDQWHVGLSDNWQASSHESLPHAILMAIVEYNK